MTGIRTRRAARTLRGLAAAGVISLTVGTALADDPPRPWLAQPPNAPPAPAPAAAEPTRIPWRASLMIGVSAAIGAAAVWARSRRGGLAKLTSSRELRVISTVRVGPKGHLVLAGIGDRALLLGVTDNSVRRIAWLPAEQIVSGAALGASDATDVANTAMVPASAAFGNVSESGPAPAGRAMSRAAAASKGPFADILRKLGGRHVDAPPAGQEEVSPAAALAELRRDTVQWSSGAGRPAASAPLLASGTTKSEAGGAELEQQAAGILKRRARKRA
jgi:flagellar biogenesis protein FliO